MSTNSTVCNDCSKKKSASDMTTSKKPYRDANHDSSIKFLQRTTMTDQLLLPPHSKLPKQVDIDQDSLDNLDRCESDKKVPICDGCLNGECGQEAHLSHPNGCLHNFDECFYCIKNY